MGAYLCPDPVVGSIMKKTPFEESASGGQGYRILWQGSSGVGSSENRLIV